MKQCHDLVSVAQIQRRSRLVQEKKRRRLSQQHRDPGALAGQAGEEGGQVARLGDPTLANANLAEIYTFPKSRSKQGGTIALTVEAEVTEKNCGRDIAAQSIELRDADLPRTQDLVLSVPECSSVGDFLVLNNLIDDLKIAAR